MAVAGVRTPKDIAQQKPVLAFLQNLWVRDPVRVTAILAANDEVFRVQFLRRLLFAGSLTGKRISDAFALCLDRMIFEEATREVAGDAVSVCFPDPAHIGGCLERYAPKLVVTFGKVAGDAVAKKWDGALVRCPHPAARQTTTLAQLKQAAAEVTSFLDQQT